MGNEMKTLSELHKETVERMRKIREESTYEDVFEFNPKVITKGLKVEEMTDANISRCE